VTVRPVLPRERNPVASSAAAAETQPPPSVRECHRVTTSRAVGGCHGGGGTARIPSSGAFVEALRLMSPQRHP